MEQNPGPLSRAIETARNYVRLFGIPVLLQAGLYPFRKAYHEGRFSGPDPAKSSPLRGLRAVWQEVRTTLGADRPVATQLAAEPWITPGRVLSHRRDGGPGDVQRITLLCERAQIEIAILAADLVRVRARPRSVDGEDYGVSFPPPFSYAIPRDEAAWPPVEVAVEEGEQELLIRTSRLHCRVDRARAAIQFYSPDGTLIHADAGGLSWDREGRHVRCARQLQPGEHVYGLGEKTTRLDKRGLAFEMWNRDPPNYEPGDDPIYSNIPFYLGLVDRLQTDGRTYGYGLFLDHSSRGRFDFGEGTTIEHGPDPGGDLHRSYFFYGPALSEVLDRYTELTGRPAMLPLWALGYHQNRWSYAPEARVREVAREFRQRRIPCEAIHLDIDYMDVFRSFTWNHERFPDPARLIADLHDQGFKVVTMIDPGIKVDRRYEVYRDGLREGVFCAYPDGRPFRGPVWPGECVFPDFCSARVRTWWGSLYRSQVDLGIDGFWNDMNEPSVFGHSGNTMPDVVRHAWEDVGADHQTAHNLYGMQMARATVEGLRALRPRDRPLVISRSVWAGSQRTCTHWLGDNYSAWSALRNVPQLVMNMGLSGIPFTGPDTGGFVGTPSPELLIRWNQLSAFTPLFRNHSNKTSGDQEPWALGEECERISRATIELRYRLLPYLYTALWQSTQTGMPLMRPLFLAFQNDSTCVSGADGRSPDDAFMVGDALLVAPVYEPGQRSRTVSLPPGQWIDFWEDTRYAGGQTVTLDAPLERIPVLVRAGSAVPTWPAMQYTGEKPVERLSLHLYCGTGSSVLYEDDGQTWDFESGAYRVTELACSLESGSEGDARLTVQRTTEGNYAPSYNEMEIIVHGLAGEIAGVTVDGQPCTEWDPGQAAAHRAPRLSVPPFHTLEIRTSQRGNERRTGEMGISSSFPPKRRTGTRC